MATDRSSGDLRGIMVPDPRFVVANVTSKTDATNPSSYTQAGSRTGVPEPQQDTGMVLRGSGDQSEDGHLEIRTLRPGHPGLEQGGFGWRDVAGGDSTSQYNGWDGPQLITGWDTLVYDTAVGTRDVTFPPDIIRLQSGKLLAVHTSQDGAVAYGRYDPTAAVGSEWTSGAKTMDGPAYTPAAATLVQLPAAPGDRVGRVLLFVASIGELQVDMYYSDDEGTTWSSGGYRLLDVEPTNADLRNLSAAYSAGEIILLLAYRTGAGALEMAQYASDDLGCSFTQINGNWAATEPAEAPHAIGLPDGGFVVVYYQHVLGFSGAYASRKAGSAFEDLTDDTLTGVGTGGSQLPHTSPRISAWLGDDGNLWALVGTGSGGVSDMAVVRSTDSGESWADHGAPAYGSGSANARLDVWGAVDTGGRVVVVSRWTATVDNHDAQSIAVLYLGGFADHTAPARQQSTAYLDSDYVSYALDDLAVGDALPGDSWLPIEEPQNVAWTAAGAGTEALVSPGVLEITTTAAPDSRTYTRAKVTDAAGAPTADTQGLFAEVALEVDAGDGDDQTLEIAARFRLSDGSVAGGAGTFVYMASLRFDSAGWALFDDNGGPIQIGATVAVDCTTRIRVRIMIDSSGNARTWYSRGGHYRDWTAGPTGAITNTVAALDSRVEWGHLTAAANVSRWELVGCCWWAGGWVPTSAAAPASAWTNPADLHPYSYPTRPALLMDSVYLAAVDGPSYLGELWDIRADYSYPLRALDATREPSPAVQWRSTGDNAVVDLIFDLETAGATSYLESSTFGIFVVNANIRSFELAFWTGAAWTTVATADATDGFAGMRYVRSGRVVRVDVGNPSTTTRYLWHEAHAGDTWEDTAGEGTRRRIEHNTEGTWTENTTKRPRLVLRDHDGTEPASGTARIWRRNFGVVIHAADQVAERWRLRIPAHNTVDRDYRIGQLLAGPVFVFGRQHDRGASRTREYNSKLTERRDWSRRARRVGPSRREVTFSWAETAVDAAWVQKASPDPDYLTGQPSTEPVAATQDVLRMIWGLVERQDRDVLPVVWLPRVPRSAQGASTVHQYTVDRWWMYGRIETDPQIDHVQGDEGVNEVERLNTITIREEA